MTTLRCRGLRKTLRDTDRHVTIGRRVDATTGKLESVSQETLIICLNSVDHVIIEADGVSRTAGQGRLKIGNR